MLNEVNTYTYYPNFKAEKNAIQKEVTSPKSNF